MKEEVQNRMERLLLDEADRLGKLEIGSDKYSKCSKTVTDLFKELNEAEKNQISERELEAKNTSEESKNRMDMEFKEEELKLKKIESEREKKKSKKEFWGKVTFAAISVITPIAVAIAENNGIFVKSTNLKPNKF